MLIFFKTKIPLKYKQDYKLLKNSGWFSKEYYLNNYPDVRQGKADPLLHYLIFGWKEGRNPSPYFNTNQYLNLNIDVKTAKINPLVHYIRFGIKENRKIGFLMSELETSIYEHFFNKDLYLKMISDIFKITELHDQSPFEHFINHGINEILSKKIAINKNFYTYKTLVITDVIREEIRAFIKKPKISIIMPVYNVDQKWLKLAIDSVLNQWYDNWELCIVDDNSTNGSTINYLKTIENEKIKIKFLSKNLHISGASNEALCMATGEYVALMDNDDELSSDALYEVVRAINIGNFDFIYSDEDKIDINGEFCEPNFKPDYSYEQLLSQNYICHLSVIKRKLIDKVGGFTIGLEGSQDHDLFLKVIEHTRSIYHIPKVLYHWRKIPGSTADRISNKDYIQKAGIRAIENHLNRLKINAQVSSGVVNGVYKVDYEIIGEPLISIIIPFKDKPGLLVQCLDSILNKSSYKNYEIIGISNNSIEKKTFEIMQKYEKSDVRIKFYEFNEPFNYSKINNYAVKNYAKGEHILLLNNDIEIISSDWLEQLLMHSQQEHNACIGAKLYYPNDTIQHAGIIIGIGGVAGHSHKHYNKNSYGYFSRLIVKQNLSGVTAAMLMVKRKIYDELEGLNETDLTVAFNDVDFCLRALEKGYVNVFNPYVEAYHHESISRGSENNPEKIKRFHKEISYMKKRHKDILDNGDSYYNINLTLDREDFSLGEG